MFGPVPMFIKWSHLGSGRHAIIHIDQSKFPGDEGADPQKVRQIQKELREKHGDKRFDLEDSDSFRQESIAEEDEIPEIKADGTLYPACKESRW